MLGEIRQRVIDTAAQAQEDVGGGFDEARAGLEEVEAGIVAIHGLMDQIRAIRGRIDDRLNGVASTLGITQGYGEVAVGRLSGLAGAGDSALGGAVTELAGLLVNVHEDTSGPLLQARLALDDTADPLRVMGDDLDVARGQLEVTKDTIDTRRALTSEGLDAIIRIAETY